MKEGEARIGKWLLSGRRRRHRISGDLASKKKRRICFGWTMNEGNERKMRGGRYVVLKYTTK